MTPMKGPGINLLDRLATLRPGRLGVVLLAALAAILLDSSVSAQTVIEIDRFGAGNAYRPGGPVAVRVIITSDQDEPVPGLIQWETSNPDGDIAANIRRIAVPGRGGVATTWVIADLPSRSDATAVTIEPWIFRLYEYRDGRRIREIASARIDPSLTKPRAAQQTEELAMVIGPNTAGLDGYGPIAGFNHRPGLNEQMVVVPNVSPGDLPDEWAGLAQYGLIVWAANDPTFYPSIIGNKPSIENALRRWIERGGHLVILLPGGSDPWRLGRNEMAFGDLLGELRRRRSGRRGGVDAPEGRHDPTRGGLDLGDVAVGEAAAMVSGVVGGEGHPKRLLLRRQAGCAEIAGLEDLGRAGQIAARIEGVGDGHAEPLEILAVDLGEAEIDALALADQRLSHADRFFGRARRRWIGRAIHVDGKRVIVALHLNDGQHGLGGDGRSTPLGERQDCGELQDHQPALLVT